MQNILFDLDGTLLPMNQEKFVTFYLPLISTDDFYLVFYLPAVLYCKTVFFC